MAVEFLVSLKKIFFSSMEHRDILQNVRVAPVHSVKLNWGVKMSISKMRLKTTIKSNSMACACLLYTYIFLSHSVLNTITFIGFVVERIQDVE